MKQIIMSLTVLCTLMLVSFMPDDQPTSVGYKPGDKAMDFSLKNIDGKMVSLADFREAKGIILIFTCNHCPYSVAYEDRIISLNATYAPKGYPVVAINSNDPIAYPIDSYENMIERATEKGFKFPYLVDETQQIAKTYGATKTPHVFVLAKADNDFYVKYIGAIDDNSNEPEHVNKRFLENALIELITGAKVSEPITKAVGCSIKWKK